MTAAAMPARRPTVGRHTAALALFTAALLLRLWRLDAQPLWFDEALSAHIAAAPDGLEFVHNTPPLYHWMTRWWTDWFGHDAFALRWLSALASAASVWATCHAAWAAFGARAAWAAAGFAAVAPLHVYYGQEARDYALLTCFLTVALWQAWRFGQAPRPGAWFGAALAAALALHTHYLAAIPLAVLVVAVPVGAAVRPLAVRCGLCGAMASAGLLLLPWLSWWTSHTAFAATDMRWLAVLWEQWTGPGAIARSLELFALGGEAGRTPIFLKQFTSMPFPAWLRVAALSALALLAVLGFLRPERPLLARAAAACLLPLVALWLVTAWVRPVYAPGRYDLIAWPAFALWFGGTVHAATSAPATGRRVVAWAAAAVLALAIAVKDVAYFRAPVAADPTRAIAERLATEVGEGDLVVLLGDTGLPVLVHLREEGVVWQDGCCRGPGGRTFACRLLPTSLEQAPAAVSRYLQALFEGSLASELGGLASAAEADRLWLVLSENLRHGDEDPALAAAGRRLFAAAFDAGFHLVGGQPELGIARLERRTGR